MDVSGYMFHCFLQSAGHAKRATKCDFTQALVSNRLEDAFVAKRLKVQANIWSRDGAYLGPCKIEATLLDPVNHKKMLLFSIPRVSSLQHSEVMHGTDLKRNLIKSYCY